ncbi:MAG: YybH family protein [Candidatus Binatia bacterium]
MTAWTPEDCDRLLCEFLAHGGLDRIVELYEPQATFVTETREALVGHAAIRASFAPLAAARPRLVANLTQVVCTGEDLAMIYNDWTMTVTPPGGAPTEMTGRAIEVVRRQPDGSWRFALDDPYGRN